MEIMDVQPEKSCRDCHTTKTPLWRAGPDGPRSLCNACGLRYRKRRALLGLDKGGAQKGSKRNGTSRNSNRGVPLNMALMGNMELDRSLGRQFRLKEEEEAAILLMALSCGSL